MDPVERHADRQPEQPPIEGALERSDAPAYLVDADRRLTYANAALCAWVGAPAERLLGEVVAWHSEPVAADDHPAAGLCPPPVALAGQDSTGRVWAAHRDGRLRTRSARFVPLTAERPGASVVLTVCGLEDQPPGDAAPRGPDTPDADALRLAVRAFRRRQAEPLAEALLMGPSPAAQKLRGQFALASQSRASATVRAATVEEGAALARALHYAVADPAARLVPLDAAVLTEEALEDAVGRALADSAPLTTLALLHADAVAPRVQGVLADALRARAPRLRVLAVPAGDAPLAPELDALVGAALVTAPPLPERLADLPLLTHLFVERENARGGAQVQGATPEALEQLALHRWPGGLTELAEVVAAAHRAATGSWITPGELPPVVRHAAIQASVDPAPTPAIVLDRFMLRVERELLERALDAARGNKAEATRLLGLSRPRLYRLLEKHGLLPAPDRPPRKPRRPAAEGIEFIELPEDPDA